MPKKKKEKPVPGGVSPDQAEIIVKAVTSYEEQLLPFKRLLPQKIYDDIDEIKSKFS